MSGSTGRRPVAPARSSSTSLTRTIAPASSSSRASFAPTEPVPWTSTFRPAGSSLPNACRASPGFRGRRRVPCGRSDHRNRRCRRYGKDVGRPPADHVHVLFARVDVRAGDVAAAERLDQVAVALEQAAPLFTGRDRRHGEHRLAASAREAEYRQLARHPGGEPEAVLERGGRLVVCLQPRPPMAGPGRVEWMQTNIQAPVASSCRTTTCSPSHRRSRSSNTSRLYSDANARRSRAIPSSRALSGVRPARGGRSPGPSKPETLAWSERRRDTRSAARSNVTPSGERGTRRRTCPRRRPFGRVAARTPLFSVAAPLVGAPAAPRPSPAARSALQSQPRCSGDEDTLTARRGPAATIDPRDELRVPDHEAEPPARHAVRSSTSRTARRRPRVPLASRGSCRGPPAVEDEVAVGEVVDDRPVPPSARRRRPASANKLLGRDDGARVRREVEERRGRGGR